LVSVTSSPLHIARPSSHPASQPNARLHCGTKRQPWLLEAPAGQQLNITLLDFTPTTAVNTAFLTTGSQAVSPSPKTSSRAGDKMNNCAHQERHRYGYIIDKSAITKNVSFCGGNGSQRLTNIHLSTGNVVELVLIHENDSSDGFNFLLGIEG